MIAAGLLVLALAAPSLEETHRRAWSAALAGDFARAEGGFRSIIDRGGDTADVWYNLGTVQVEAGHPVDGIVSFLAGLRRAPSHPGLQENLRVTREHLGIDARRRGPNLAGWADRVPFWAWTLLLILSNGFLAISTFRRRWAWAIGASAPWVLSGAALAVLHHAAQRPLAVVTQQAPLKDGPADWYRTVTTLDAGLDLIPHGPRDGAFQRVRTADGKEGWVAKARLIRVEPFEPFD